MAWHETLYNVLTQINNVVLICIGIPFILQFLYMLLSWLPKKKFKKSDKLHRICVVIPAHNEEDVIYDTVKLLFDKQTYPRELFDVYVVAHNCDDKTAERARCAGATVFELNDPDPSHRRVSYALKHIYDKILETGIEYDFSIRLDADNHINDEFFSLMNDAYSSGVQIARPYESALNMTQNHFTTACGLYYIFDSRFSSRVRERLHIDAHVNGPGSLTAMKIIKEIGGYDTKSICEDTEFCFKRMLDGYRCHFVEDAVVYEDLPSSFRDTLNRNKRIASGNVRLLGRYTLPMLWNTLRQFRFSFIEQILTYAFMLICVILCTWLPGYYIYAGVYLGVNGYFTNEAMAAVGLVGPGLWQLLIIVGAALLFLFIFAGLLQGFVLVLCDYKKMGAKKRRELFSGVLLFPAFTVVYCVTMALGVFSRPKWNKINRNTGGELPTPAMSEEVLLEAAVS
ncbi:MAG: glycosyltransferase family 2 protein, partial [Clostridiales bacterium]|nr:glycosyltransferase family 2 protein [Clostridiales bacterium]